MNNIGNGLQEKITTARFFLKGEKIPHFNRAV